MGPGLESRPVSRPRRGPSSPRLGVGNGSDTSGVSLGTVPDSGPPQRYWCRRRGREPSRTVWVQNDLCPEPSSELDSGRPEGVSRNLGGGVPHPVRVTPGPTVAPPRTCSGGRFETVNSPSHTTWELRDPESYTNPYMDPDTLRRKSWSGVVLTPTLLVVTRRRFFLFKYLFPWWWSLQTYNGSEVIVDTSFVLLIFGRKECLSCCARVPFEYLRYLPRCKFGVRCGGRGRRFRRC